MLIAWVGLAGEFSDEDVHLRCEKTRHVMYDVLYAKQPDRHENNLRIAHSPVFGVPTLSIVVYIYSDYSSISIYLRSM